MPEAARLASASRASMIAPAGYGKTEIIARAVKDHERRRTLVMTHTHAGVDALRARLRRLGAAPESFEVITIASWALRLGLHYPGSTGTTSDTPTDDEWKRVYEGLARLLRARAIREAVAASHGSVYVDEYQDCSVSQHVMVSALSAIVPCRVVGDPLQAIFDFRGDSVRWLEHVAPTFPDLAGPTLPRRWEASNPSLGTWLDAARRDLEAGRPLRIDSQVVTWIRPPSAELLVPTEVRACRSPAVNAGENLVAIIKWPAMSHSLAKHLGGQFSCIEPIEADDLMKAASSIEGARGCARAARVIEFARLCMIGVSTPTNSIHGAFEAGREPLRVRNHLPQRDACLVVARETSYASILAAIDSLGDIDGVFVHRRELLAEMRRALRTMLVEEHASLPVAARAVRDRTRVVGRRFPRYAVGTTLLVKGLEFDHAVVLRPDLLDAKNLYVAITRARRSLTIVSSTMEVTPAAR
jgi:hypothetical protein